MKARSGGRILVEALKAHGVRQVFCVPGESYLDALDALADAPEIRVTACRHEGGAAFMAEAYAKLTGRPGVCFVTRGPGACNASIGVHTAMQDSTPLILLVGQVAREQRGREAFQEIEYRDMFAPPTAKWVEQAESAAALPRAVALAFEMATSGRPGPVVLALPEDVLSEDSDAPVTPPAPLVHFAPAAGEVEKAREILAAAQRPLAIVGGGGWCEESITAFAAFCARAEIPVATSFRRQDAFPNTHPCHAGTLAFTVDPRLCAAVREADVILAVGTRLSDVTTQGYTLLSPGVPRQTLIHAHPEASELNRVYHAQVAVHAPVKDFARALSGLDMDGAFRTGWRAARHADYVDWSTPKGGESFEADMDGIARDLDRLLPADAVITTDAGNFSGWAQRYLKYDRPRRLLAPTSGAMGYGVPAAVAASLTCPGRAVVGLAGDGGFLMTGQEIATALQAGAKPVLIVFNNGMYGTIRMHQEKHFPGRPIATDLRNPDFAALARSYGARGVTVTRTADFASALTEGLSADLPTVIEVKMDPDQLSTQKRLSDFKG